MRALLGLSALCSIWLFAGAATAQKPKRDNQPFILTRDTPDVGASEVARARARKGDCKGALEAYDAAVKTSIDPELRRDRGLCHERLGNTYPAIDDYRTYLKDRPNAPDNDQIRERLARLEEQVGLGGRGEKPTGDDSSKIGASGSISIGTAGVSAEGSTSGSAGGGKSGSQSDFERHETLASQASGSPLREASGWILGPYLGFRSSADVSSKQQGFRISMGINEAVGAALRYSLGKVSTILMEFGYVHFNDAKISGPGMFLGYEARFALSQFTSDAIIAGAGVGYERYRQSDTGGILNNLLPRARVGYRHVFGAAVALEATADGGIGYYWLKDASSGQSLSLTPVFGGYLALVVGF